jgi:small ligand-binding sensory domain FIST
MPATGLARGDPEGAADPRLAAEAVQAALAKLGTDRARTVLLLLSGHFNRNPLPAIHAAARAAQTTQIAGCTSVGVYTEDAWVIGRPAAAAMLFAQSEAEAEVSELMPVLAARDDDWLLSLAAPNAAHRDWLAMPGNRVGAIAGDNNGRGPFPVWSSGKLLDAGRLDLHLPRDCRVTVSPGLTPLSSLVGVTEVRDFDLMKVANKPALTTLVSQALPHLASTGEPFPWHRLLLARADDEPRLALASGEYELMPVLGVSPTRSLVVGGRLLEGDRIFSVLREPGVAKQELDVRLTTARGRDRKPRYALLFSCAGRGPGFFDGRDADWESVRRLYPKLPLIGFYGNGEIARVGGRNRLLQFASACALVS